MISILAIAAMVPWMRSPEADGPTRRSAAPNRGPAPTSALPGAPPGEISGFWQACRAAFFIIFIRFELQLSQQASAQAYVLKTPGWGQTHPLGLRHQLPGRAGKEHRPDHHRSRTQLPTRLISGRLRGAETPYQPVRRLGCPGRKRVEVLEFEGSTEDTPPLAPSVLPRAPSLGGLWAGPSPANLILCRRLSMRDR